MKDVDLVKWFFQSLDALDQAMYQARYVDGQLVIPEAQVIPLPAGRVTDRQRQLLAQLSGVEA